MSTTTGGHTHGPIPTLEQVYEATDGLQEAYNPIEHIAGSVERIADRWEREGEAPDPLPTIADIGSLLVFCEYVEQSAGALADEATDVRSRLVVLENLRREAGVKGASNA